MLKGLGLVLVGASGAIGGHFLQVALEQGARVVSIGLEPPKGYALHHSADICSLESVQQAAEVVFQQLGQVDILLNFSGAHHKPMDLALDDPVATLEDFDRVLGINLRGAFILTMVFGRRMLAQRQGQMIHLCSNASRLALYGSYAYNASKHGLEGLIKTAAAQFAPYGVRVNGVAPGTVESPLNTHLLRDPVSGRLSARAASILAHTPTKRFVSLEGIAETLVAVCMPQRHFTGNVIFCDDGYNIEGHSWPEGNRAVYGDEGALERLYERLGSGA